LHILSPAVPDRSDELDADVVLAVQMTDVNCRPDSAATNCPDGVPPDKSTSSDYLPSPAGPDGTFLTRIRITDDNCASALNCTSADQNFPAPVFCTATPTRPDVGSSCQVTTTANTLVPGVIPTSPVQSNIALFRIRGCDNGATGGFGAPGCAGDDRQFVQAGLWIP
jgi:hypothetical protein